MQERDGERPGGAAAAADEPASRARAEAGTLYVVATPLGNLRDITLRAIDILASADVVAAEDTRVTTPLLRRFGIATRPLSLHGHNEARRVARVLAELRAQRSVALVSDAGTPAVSDPGARLAREVRAAGFPVVPVPGANAAIAAFSVAGLDAERFLFLGFLPTGSGDRRALLEAVAALPYALAIYEAPHRVRATASALAEALGGERDLVVARELTKKFETIARMPLAEAPGWFAADANRERGELVLLVDSARPRADDAHTDTLAPEAERWLAALVDELPPARAARVVAAVSGAPRDLAYARALALKR